MYNNLAGLNFVQDAAPEEIEPIEAEDVDERAGLYLMCI